MLNALTKKAFVLLGVLVGAFTVTATVETMRPPMAQAQPQSPASVPPPLSLKRRAYYKSHPADYQQLLQRLPHRNATPAAAPASSALPPTGQRWRTTATPAPGSVTNPLLLTDGSVIMHNPCNATWYKLTPRQGDYVYGTWSSIAAPGNNYAPLYHASQILSDGKVIINGGEYLGCNDAFTTQGALYDPATNTWTAVTPPSGWSMIGDASSIILNNGSYMLANCCTTQSAIWSELKATWTPTGFDKADINDEEGWVLLPTGNVLTTDAYVQSNTCGTATERYTQGNGSWSSAGNATTQLSDCTESNNPSYEVGPAVLRPSGTVVAFSGLSDGSVAGTSIYNALRGGWSPGPVIPAINSQNYDLADAPGVELPNGNILFAASPGLFQSPTHFFEFGTTDRIFQVSDLADSSNSNNPSYVYNFLMLPTGQVLETDQSSAVEIYTPTGSPKPEWAPTISDVPTTLKRAATYQISGTQLNGLSHGNYGDDVQAATNFPLVQITNNATGDKAFAKTFGFSNRAIKVGQASTASFTMGAGTEVGASTLVVIANGISSSPVSVTIGYK